MYITMATEAQASNVAATSVAGSSVAGSSVAEQNVTSGRVKWFNNKAGYGFITVGETNEERDLFVHHSEIRVLQTQYKYLVQGEYVEFTIAPITRENKIDTHATNVRGINGGKLMCETRNEIRTYRSAPQNTQGQQTQAQQTQAQQTQAQQTQAQQTQPRQSKPKQVQTKQGQAQELRRPQLDKSDQTEWMVVPRRRTETTYQKSQPRQRQPVIEIAQ
jgi:cold shock CspA family protein